MAQSEMTATEWIEEWLRDGIPDDRFLVQRLQELRYTPERIKAFLEGL